MKAFNQIDVKKMKALRNTFWADFKRAWFVKNVRKSAFRFPEEYSTLFEPFFFAGKLMPKEWFVEKVFVPRLEAFFFSPKLTLRYLSK